MQRTLATVHRCAFRIQPTASPSEETRAENHSIGLDNLHLRAKRETVYEDR
ncbi:hypothetical protein ACSS6W_000400 [Trichoderma asperelloides]